jgi:hypothetical protein
MATPSHSTGHIRNLLNQNGQVAWGWVRVSDRLWSIHGGTVCGVVCGNVAPRRGDSPIAHAVTPHRRHLSLEQPRHASLAIQLDCAVQRASIQPGRDFRLGLETYAESVVYTWLRLLDEVLRMTSPTKSHTIVAGGEET